MSAEPRRIVSFLSIALLVGLIPAQEKPKTVDELRKENAALRAQVKTLQAQRDARKNAARKGLVLQRGNAVLTNNVVGWVFNDPRLTRWEGLRGRLNSDYLKSVERLRRATQKLNPINDPAKARKLADEVERALLDVRRELWKLEQAEKKKAKDPTKKKDKQPDSSVVFVKVPVLAVPIRLDLNWPVLSEATDSKDDLFFSFRRF